MTEKRQQFEEWWSIKEHLFPTQLKESFWIAFSDGWYRCSKLTAKEATP